MNKMPVRSQPNRGQSLCQTLMMHSFSNGTPAASAELLARAFAATARMSLITDAQQNILHVGNSFITITGYGADEVLGRNCRLLQGPGTDRAVVATISATLRAGDAFEGDILNYRKDGSPFWNGLKVTPLRGPANEITHYVSTQSDINTRRAFQDTLRFQALHDVVTDLPNRRYLEQHLARDRTDLQASVTAIGLINIDEFRRINEQVGLRGGDELLRALGRRLRNLTGEGVFLASMKGDEYAVVIDDLGSLRGSADIDDQLEAVLRRLHEAVERPFQVLGKSVSVTISMGVAFCPLDSDDILDCLRVAEVALKVAQRRRHDRQRWWYLAPPVIETGTQATAILMESRATQAEQTLLNQRFEADRLRLFNGGLSMYMQPVVDLRTGDLSRVEALARLILVDGTVVGPDRFLSFLDDAGHDELFRLGLDEALGCLARWDREGLSTRVSVNLSPSTLYDSNCTGWVKGALERHNINPSRLSLELLETESAKSAVQIAAINDLRTLGIGLALDDLGSGHATLKRLSELPFDSIKLDRGLFASLNIRPLETLSMLATLTQMGRDFKIGVVAEGLEDVRLAEAAVVLGVPLGQGYFLARPMPASSIPGWVAAYKFPLSAGMVTTALGALAYHWKFLRWESPHPLPLSACPLTDFMQRHTPQTSRATALHEQQHEPFNAPSTGGQQLQEWLVELVQDHATAAG
ncbi:GGDEF domain-containing phosphodiesterase [Cryobacterium ruanii]|nr:GGDEF domain-containing phosphodiesterase [Cryobacterium ruanii]